MALHFLKSLGYIHADIKPANILFLPQDRSVRLIDFGNSHREGLETLPYFKSTNALTPGFSVQTLHYRSPEILIGLPYDSSIDMWSFGCLAFELLFRTRLFTVRCPLQLVEEMEAVTGQWPQFKEGPISVLPKGRFYRQYFHPDGVRKFTPAERPRLSEQLAPLELSWLFPALAMNPAERAVPSQLLRHAFIGAEVPELPAAPASDQEAVWSYFRTQSGSSSLKSDSEEDEDDEDWDSDFDSYFDSSSCSDRSCSPVRKENPSETDSGQHPQYGPSPQPPT